MEHIFEHLRADYRRWRRELRLDEGGEVPYPLKIDDVLRAHYLLCDYFMREGEDIAAVGPRDLVLLPSAVSRQGAGYGAVSKWPEPIEQIATLFYGLVKNHAFHDGNKRTALLTALYHLRRVGKAPAGEQREFETVAVRTAGNNLDEYSWYDSAKKRHADEHDRRVFVLSKFFRRHSRDIDKRHYAVTFNQLDTILRRFGYRLDHPNGNYIDVVTDVEVKKYLGLQKRTEERRVLRVGFPGWTREVSRNAVASIRTATGLTAANGCDSDVFYKGSDALNALISNYHGPLIRLKDR